MKQFPHIDIEQNKISSAFLLNNIRSAPFARKSRCFHILFYITKSVFYLISDYIFVYITHLGYFFLMLTKIYQVYG